ncbi:hypothetical protein WDW86_04010 [Bdellovibrionota bacterium FG-2]
MVTEKNLAKNSKISSSAPTRIDLAGGTLDIWPLYLMTPQALTINLGIDLFAAVTLETSQPSPADFKGPRIILRSEDLQKEEELTWAELFEKDPIPALSLHTKLLRHFILYETRYPDKLKKFNLTLTTRALSPAGAGLGGSSALAVALIGALFAWVKGRSPTIEEEGEALIKIARDVETTVIQVPAGVQDYYGAMFGGLQLLKWGTGHHTRRKLGDALASEVEKRLMLFYSGQSRNSGINNWTLTKDFIDNKASTDVRTRFAKIATATVKLEQALDAQNWEAARLAIAEEWETRRTLASGISTPEMDRAFLEAQKIHPLAEKICGAGGGGCFFVFLDQPISESLAQSFKNHFQTFGMRHLPFRGVSRGLDIQVSHA